MKNYRSLFMNLLQDESGQDLIEYALVATVIGLGAIAAVTTCATAISGAFTSLGNKLTANNL